MAGEPAVTPVQQLAVLWSDPSSGARHVIGRLWRDGGSFAFAYAADTDKYMSKGFSLLPEFPRGATTYRSAYLFPSFSQRIPSPTRPDFQRLMREWGVAHADEPLEILARSGGVQLTDRIELAEYRDEKDDLSRPLSFRVAGGKFREAVDLQPGDPVILRHEPDNQFDKCATLVLLRQGKPVGYVPRQYSALISGHLASGHALESVAERRLTVPPDRGRWVISVKRAN